MEDSRFYTLKGYQEIEQAELTPAMEDYLEMICRLLRSTEVVRIGELANGLHVKPSSASKMIQQLVATGYVDAQKYGYVRLTEKGRAAGEYLLYRHDVVERFLQLLNGGGSELVEAEKLEHFLDRATVSNLERLITQLERK
ncbi:MAG: metal-dependent transcriptional regulator [Clostridia bacterium]|nr:metal-dependent transcriptional regulator [Clostridia bacterium]